MLNVKLLDDTLAWAEAEWDKTCLGLRSEWDQMNWARRMDCGTTTCMAGRIVVSELGWDAIDWKRNEATALGNVRIAYEVAVPYDGLLDIGNVAAHLLGLDDPEWAEALFYDATTIEQVRDAVARIKEAHGPS